MQLLVSLIVFLSGWRKQAMLEGSHTILAVEMHICSLNFSSQNYYNKV